jgi:hypothetical protein
LTCATFLISSFKLIEQNVSGVFNATGNRCRLELCLKPANRSAKAMQISNGLPLNFSMKIMLRRGAICLHGFLIQVKMQGFSRVDVSKAMQAGLVIHSADRNDQSDTIEWAFEIPETMNGKRA